MIAAVCSAPCALQRRTESGLYGSPAISIIYRDSPVCLTSSSNLAVDLLEALAPVGFLAFQRGEDIKTPQETSLASSETPRMQEKRCEAGRTGFQNRQRRASSNPRRSPCCTVHSSRVFAPRLHEALHPDKGSRQVINWFLDRHYSVGFFFNPRVDASAQ
jgi:hypothetical protein